MPVTQLVSRITRYDGEVESAEVLKRIAELEDRALAQYRITQTRTGLPLYPGIILRSADDAVKFLDERDYNIDRFTVTKISGPDELSQEDRDELDALRQLNESGRAMFGSQQWITDSVLLRPNNFFDGDWARSEAGNRLGAYDYQLDEWPFGDTDWSVAAGELLEAEYLSVEFGDVTFWGAN